MIFHIIIAITLALQANGFPEEENDDKDGLFFGGDMLLTPSQRRQVESGGDFSLARKREKRAILSMKTYLWFDNNKTIPYNIHPDLEKKAEATFGMMLALREWEERSCLKFVRRTDQQDYINFFEGSGCWSYVGKLGGAQDISLRIGCWNKGTIVHEIGHAMGFGHEQNRPDRDDYITILWENIEKVKSVYVRLTTINFEYDSALNFIKYNDSIVDSLNSKYDYKSIMQYSKRSFGINNSVTLQPKQKDIFQLGQRFGFAESDQYQAMALYQCEGKTTRKPEKVRRYVLTGKDDCDFENGLCGYTQDSSDDFDWLRRYGATDTKYTGPETDHTTERLGVYIYVEASYPRNPNEVARFLSKTFHATSKKICLSFHYHMFAKEENMMGSLNVYLSDAENSRKLLMNQNGSTGINDWIEKNLIIRPCGKYQIIFEGIRGDGFQSDIAIDDISFAKGSCKMSKKRNNKDVSKQRRYRDWLNCSEKTCSKTCNGRKPCLRKCRRKCWKNSWKNRSKRHMRGDWKRSLRKGKCLDIDDREAHYCTQWKEQDFCLIHEKEMKKFCAKTCNFCT